MKDIISIKGARENNLKDVNVDIPKNCLVVITGPSGSGKSSIAFDTIYAEGQRKYMESLSSGARYYFNENLKPDLDSITGLSPAIAIDQKTTSNNPRSTVGTITEIYDYLRVLYSRIGKLFDKNGNVVKKYSPSQVADFVSNLPVDTKIRISAPLKIEEAQFEAKIKEIKTLGYERIRINNRILDINDLSGLLKSSIYKIDVIVDRIIIKEGILDRLSKAVEVCMKISAGFVKIEFVEFPNKEESYKLNNEILKVEEFKLFSDSIYCEETGKLIQNLEPNMFSFNSPFGACKNCNGLGYDKFFDENLIIPNQSLSILDGAIEVWQIKNTRYYRDLALALARHFKFDINQPYETLSSDIKQILLYGSDDEIEIENNDNFKKRTIKKKFSGIINEIQADYENSEGDEVQFINFERYQNLLPCKTCSGLRLNQTSLMVKINNYNIGQLCELDISDLIKWIEDFQKKTEGSEKEISDSIFKEIKSRLIFLIEVGLDYLNLNRSSATLSGGEAQRIRLSSQISSALSGVIYVLDEPSIGLHQSDNSNLIQSLKKLVSSENTVIVVEHDEETMRAADHIIDVGPGAGKYGGEIIAQGTLEEICNNHKSITGNFLSGREFIEVPKARRKFGRSMAIELKNARENNLKNINLKIPLGLLIAFSGISGSGKSTLVLDTLYLALYNKLNNSNKKAGKFDEILGTENINKVIKIDQDPIGRTPRSNPATYVGLFVLIRDLFTALPESRKRGYKSSRFSFNVKGGRCENCKGDGQIKVEMLFLPDIYTECEVCHGNRYNKETLEIKYKGYNISQVLKMNPREALEIFKDIPSIKEKLSTLIKVGLDYIQLGQSSTTLSGGEAQRIKLSKELSKKATGDTIYFLDEPTTGLHHVDIKKLLNVLETIVDNGNTVIVIEHNLEVLKTADLIIDMGPAGGKKGGMIVSQGTPEEVAQDLNSVTGKYLKPLLPKLNR